MNEMQIYILVFFGAIAIWFGWRVFMTSSMVRSAFSLLASMAALGAIFLTLEAEFLGVLQLMMMATEMSIMAIFMMMFMMDPGGLGAMDMTHQKKISIYTGIVVGALVLLMSVLIPWSTQVHDVPSTAIQNHDLGIEIMERSMMIFESAGVTILVAMIAATAIALPNTKT